MESLVLFLAVTQPNPARSKPSVVLFPSVRRPNEWLFVRSLSSDGAQNCVSALAHPQGIASCKY